MPTKYAHNDYVMLTDAGEPKTFQEVMSVDHKKELLKSMKDEMQSLHENQTYDLVKLPHGNKDLRKKMGV